MLADSWVLILTQHVYEADALQISSHILDKCNAFLSSDKELINTAKKMGLEAYNIVEEESKMREIISS